MMAQTDCSVVSDHLFSLSAEQRCSGGQVKAQVQQFRDREARLAEAEQLASTHSGREAALAARQQNVSDLEDKAQRANAAAEYARKEADAMWQKQKVRHLGCVKCCVLVLMVCFPASIMPQSCATEYC